MFQLVVLAALLAVGTAEEDAKAADSGLPMQMVRNIQSNYRPGNDGIYYGEDRRRSEEAERHYTGNAERHHAVNVERLQAINAERHHVANAELHHALEAERHRTSNAERHRVDNADRHHIYAKNHHAGDADRHKSGNVKHAQSGMNENGQYVHESRHGHDNRHTGPEVLRMVEQPYSEDPPMRVREEENLRNIIIKDAYNPDYYEPKLTLDYRYLKTGGRDYTRSDGGQILILPRNVHADEHKEFPDYDALLEFLRLRHRAEIDSRRWKNHYRNKENDSHGMYTSDIDTHIYVGLNAKKDSQ